MELEWWNLVSNNFNEINRHFCHKGRKEKILRNKKFSSAI